jgi:hypothetical protein
LMTCGSISAVLWVEHWGQSGTLECPRCGEQEVAQHVWTCQAPMAWVIKSKALFSLRKHLSDTVTEPDISRLLMAWLTAWVMNTRCYPQRTQVEGIQAKSTGEPGPYWMDVTDWRLCLLILDWSTRWLLQQDWLSIVRMLLDYKSD